MDKILKKLNVKNNPLTKPVKKQKVFNKVKNNIPPIKNYNFQADLLYMPKTKDGFKYILAVVDLANNAFDIQPMKTKTAEATLEAFKALFKRKYIKMPEVSIRTDNGTEFKKEFHKYLRDNKIVHSFSLPYRHKQMANVEALNKQLYFLFSSYMNQKEQATNKPYNEWLDIIEPVRKLLNEHRIIKLPTFKEFIKNVKVYNDEILNETPKYKIGNFVYYALDYPRNALNNEQPTANFRVGDLRYNPIPKKIIKVVYMTDRPFFRYVLDGVKNVSYAENELLPSKETEQKYEIKELIRSKIIYKNKYYLVHWKGYKKKDATWVSEKSLEKDVGKPFLDELVKQMK